MTDLFIVVLLLFLWGWDYPADHPARRLVQKFSRPFVYLGLWHGWAMFAPEPIHVLRRVTARIRFQDGSVEVWEPVRPQARKRLMNTLYVRSFKYQHSLLSSGNRHLWAPLCGFLARCAAQSGRRVESVELLRDSRAVNEPGAAALYGPCSTVSLYRQQSAGETRETSGT